MNTRLTLTLAGGALATVAVLGGYHAIHEPALSAQLTSTAHGALTLTDADMTDCEPSDGYDDIHSGTDVTVTDAKGDIVAATTLEAGTPSGDSSCEFDWSAAGVPVTSTAYRVEVSHRGTVTFAPTELFSHAGARTVLGDSDDD